jgi:hypothetical protein
MLVQPRRASIIAAARPVGPPPTTTVLLGWGGEGATPDPCAPTSGVSTTTAVVEVEDEGGSGSAIAPGVETSRPRRERAALRLHRDTSMGRIEVGPWRRAVTREDGRFVLDTATGPRVTSVDDIVIDGIAFIPQRSGRCAHCAVARVDNS